MATSRKTRTVINPAGRVRRKLTPKQIKFFGTARQKAALRRSRQRKATAAPVRKAHVKPARRAPVMENPGEILSVVLNPAKEKVKMAQTKKRTAAKPRPARHKKNAGTHHRMSAAPHKSRSHRKNPSRRRRTRRMQSNPSSPRVGGLLSNALWIITGAVGSKLITQAVLGEKNTGVFGYGGNALVTALLGVGTSKMLKNPQAGNAVIAGGVVQIVLRALTDFTPFGKFTQTLGLGDYLASNFVTPQRYVDPLNSAMVEIPGGWAPKVLPPPAPAAAGMGSAGLYSGASSLY